jgi:hypothetical protein
LPLLKTGVKLANFQLAGKLHERTEVQKIINKGTARDEAQFLKKIGETPSGPHAVSSLRPSKAASTSWMVKLTSPTCVTGDGDGRDVAFRVDAKKLFSSEAISLSSRRIVPWLVLRQPVVMCFLFLFFYENSSLG